MGSDASDLGKGLFGYRRSVVQQIISDREVMLRQAEGRVRAAESRVAELEDELSGIRERSRRMEDQLERLRSMVERTAAGQASALEDFPPPPVMGEMPEDAPASDATVAFEDEMAGGEGLVGETVDEDEPHMPMEMSVEYEVEEASPAYEAEEASPAYEPIEYATQFDTAEPGFDEESAAGAEPEPEVDAYAFTAGDVLEDAGYSGEELQAQPGDAFDQTYEAAAEGTVEDLDAAPFQEVDEVDVPFDASDQEEEKEELVTQDTEVEVGADHRAEGANSPNSNDITARFLTEELAGILTAAEESAARIVERAQASTEQQLAEANRMWREVQSEVARFAAWRREVEPLIEQVREKVGEVRERVETVPERIREALAPMADAISSVDAELAELATAAPPPLLVSPSGLESDAEWDAGAEGMDMADMADYDSGSLTGQDVDAGASDDAYPADELVDETPERRPDSGAA